MKERKIKKENKLLKKFLKNGAVIGSFALALVVGQQLNVFAVDDPLTVINNLSNLS